MEVLLPGVSDTRASIALCLVYSKYGPWDGNPWVFGVNVVGISVLF